MDATARHLGIIGWGRNAENGTVHIVTEASPETLDELESHPRKGPEGVNIGDMRRERKKQKGCRIPSK